MLTREDIKKKGILRHKTVSLLGLGTENLDLLPYLVEEGAIVKIHDKQDAKALEIKLRSVEKKINLYLGNSYLSSIKGSEVIFVSPGVPKKIVNSAVKNVLIMEPLEFFMLRTPAKVIGVTGTKGKSTTASLIYHIIKTAKKRVFLAGNIGMAPFKLLDRQKRGDIIVLELSSFQLENMETSPDVAVVLDITEDHLSPVSLKNPNFHISKRAYITAKRRIIDFQTENDVAVLCESVSKWAHKAKGKVWQFTLGRKRIKNGVKVKGTDFVRVLEGKERRICSTGLLPLRGEHNLLNAAAAIAAALAVKVTPKNIVKALPTFISLPHRLQVVGRKNGVLYVDDSLSTNPYTAAAAVESFKQPIWLIAGGVVKDVDFKILTQAIFKNNVKGVATIGEDGPKIAQELNKSSYKGVVKEAKTLENAVTFCKNKAQKGDVILLSPACKSFDQFESAYVRGEKFQELINDDK